MFYTALIMGLAGSLHCAGMCSPLAMAITRNNPFVLARVLYNAGRVLTYAILGAMVATVGTLVQLAPYQQIISISLGCIFLLMGMGGISSIRIPYMTAGINHFTGWLKLLFGSVLKIKSMGATILLGMLNGLLPCGLTYLALTACLISPTPMDGFLFMIFFGLGTWPVMIGLTWVLNISFFKRAFNAPRLSKIALIFVGCLLFARVWMTHSHSMESAANVSCVETVCE